MKKNKVKNKVKNKTNTTSNKKNIIKFGIFLLFCICFCGIAGQRQKVRTEKKRALILSKPGYSNGYVYDLKSYGGRGGDYIEYKYQVNGHEYNSEASYAIGGEIKWYGKENYEKAKIGDSILIMYYEYDPEINMVLKVIKTKKGG